jgi:catechol 2,3-dioxygenase-like lactoylglutathione lyase family enzyme
LRNLACKPLIHRGFELRFGECRGAGSARPRAIAGFAAANAVGSSMNIRVRRRWRHLYRANVADTDDSRRHCQAGNGLELVARDPMVGSADICPRWSGGIETAVTLLREHGIPVVDGPSRRRTVDGLPAHSIYFRDPDGNLLELMAADRLPHSRSDRRHLTE